MQKIEINENTLEKVFQEFSEYIKEKDKKPFTTFKDSNYIDERENYKYEIYEEAKKVLESKLWKSEDIGTGKIRNKVWEAIHIKKNNLITGIQYNRLGSIKVKVELEELLFDFYNNKKNDEKCFSDFFELQKKKLYKNVLNYNVIAYLYFIKGRNKYLPIAQKKFDKIFKEILHIDFKTERNTTWENYSTYLDIIKQTRDFLKDKGTEPELLDAHSFLYTLGEIYNFYSDDNKKIETQKSNSTEVPTKSNLPKEFSYPDELPEETSDKKYTEGLKKTIIVNAYERNSKARKKCIEHYGSICAVCNFDFEQAFGIPGKGYIHVHHLKPISEIGETYEIDPIKDLIPVCPNCHAMIHKKEPPFSIEALKKMIKIKYYKI